MSRDRDLILELLCGHESLGLQTSDLRNRLSKFDDVEIEQTLEGLAKGRHDYACLLPALKVMLGDFGEEIFCDHTDVEGVSQIIVSLMRHANDPTYGGNVRNVVAYYRSCDGASRSKIACVLLKMLELDHLRGDARTIIAGAAIFSGWREPGDAIGDRVLGQKVRGERLNPVRLLRKRRSPR